MNESIKNLLERRSIRAYKKDLVPQETLDVILKAGEYSPSGMGQQSTLMVVTQDPDLVAKLSRMNAAVMGSKSDPFYGAPTVITIFGPKRFLYSVPDAFCAAENMVLEATALGLASCILARGEETFDNPEGEKILQSWNIPDTMVARSFVILGYIDGDYPTSKPRKEGRFVIIK